MTYSPDEIKSWAHAAARLMRDHGHTGPDSPITVGELADRVGFNPCQWPRVKEWLFALGYPLAQRFGRGGGFYLGEKGAQATILTADQRYILTRIKSAERHQRQVSQLPDYPDVVEYAKEKLEHNLLSFAGLIGTRAAQLALPAPSLFGRN